MIVTWTVELGEFDIRYKPRMAIKGQALADFIKEFCFTENPKDEDSTGQEGGNAPCWTLYVDGSSTTE